MSWLCPYLESPIWESTQGVGKNFFPFLDLELGLEGKEYKPLNFTLPAGTVNMVIYLSLQ